MFDFLKKKQKPQPESAQASRDERPTNPGAAPDFTLSASLLSDIGCTRPVNQDSGVIVHPANGSPRGTLVVVADGMGGHKGGEVASQRAVEVVTRVYYDKAKGQPQQDLVDAFLEANQAIYNQSLEAEEYKGMGTTCTALALLDGVAYSAHIGDSRMYLIRGGDIYLMTEDHSAVMQMVKEGTLTLEEARHHTDKNVITRAMGSKPQVEVSVWPEPFPVRVGDRFVLCSDGLYDRIEDSEIRDIAVSKDSAGACELMVQIARQRGGYDNITVAVLSLGPAAPEEEKPIPPTREMEVRL